MSDEKLTTAATLHWNDAKSDEEIVRFGPDGVWVNPDIPMDEAARKFLDIVHAMWGAHFTRPAIEEERARIVALIHEQIAHWESEPVLRHWEDSADDFDEVIALKRLLRRVEDTSHE